MTNSSRGLVCEENHCPRVHIQIALTRAINKCSDKDHCITDRCDKREKP